MKSLLLISLLGFVCLSFALDCSSPNVNQYCLSLTQYIDCALPGVPLPVAPGTNCQQDGGNITLVSSAPSGCGANPIGWQECISLTQWTFCAAGGAATFDVPAGTQCSDNDAGEVVFFGASNGCSPLGAQTCINSNTQFTVCGPSGLVTFDVPAGTSCVQNGTEIYLDYTAADPSSPCGEVGVQTCINSNTQFSTCTWGGEVVQDVPAGTHCEQDGDRIQLVLNAGEDLSPCGDVGVQTCINENTQFTVCTWAGLQIIDAPTGATCVQNGTQVYFDLNPSEIVSSCGEIGVQTCQGLESYTECTPFGSIVREVAAGTHCSQDGDRIELVNALAEVVDEQAQIIASLKKKLSASESGIEQVLPSLVVLAASALFFF